MARAYQTLRLAVLPGLASICHAVLYPVGIAEAPRSSLPYTVRPGTWRPSFRLVFDELDTLLNPENNLLD